MNRFAALIDALLLTPSRNGKLRLMQDYFATTEDPERGWALAALTGELSFAEAKPSQVRDLAISRVDPELFTPRADYLLRVSGLSMRDAGILDGDLLAVHKTDEARSGQIVVARVGGLAGDEVTVKRLQRRGKDIVLVAENPTFAPIVVDLKKTTLAIEGIAVGIVRRNPL